MSRYLAWIILGTWFCLICSSQLDAQSDQFLNKADLAFEIGTVIGEGRNLPFWMHANRDGIIDRFSNNGYGRINYQSGDLILGPLRYHIGAELVGRVSDNSSLFFNQGYVQLEWKDVQLIAGRKLMSFGLQDTALSAGSLTVSRNASPIPQLIFKTRDFINIPGTDSWLAIKGFYSHGWLGDPQVAEGAFLHQKYMYLRFFSGQSNFNFLAGITHHSVWGGNHRVFGKLPSGFNDYIDVVLDKSSSDAEAPLNEQAGTLGSAIASYDMGIKYRLNSLSILFSRMFLIEASPIDPFENVWNGSWSLSINGIKKTGVVTGFYWNHINTKDTNGNAGTNNFYNNGIYWSGWTYRQRTIGSPFLFSDGRTPGVVNNLVLVHSWSLAGNYNNFINYKLNFSYSRNYGAPGIFEQPEDLETISGLTGRQDQYSLLLDINHRIRERILLRLNLGYDFGALYEDQAGVLVGLVFNK